MKNKIWISVIGIAVSAIGASAYATYGNSINTMGQSDSAAPISHSQKSAHQGFLL